MSVEVEQPRLLPGVLVPDHSGPRRTTRDWLVDAGCFLVAAGFGGGVLFCPPQAGALAPVVLAGLLAVPVYLATQWAGGGWWAVVNLGVVVGATLVWGMFIRARRQ